jgi:hypothetical protein
MIPKPAIQTLGGGGERWNTKKPKVVAENMQEEEYFFGGRERASVHFGSETVKGC